MHFTDTSPRRVAWIYGPEVISDTAQRDGHLLLTTLNLTDLNYAVATFVR